MSEDSICASCSRPVTEADKEFAENQEQHPGVLGLVHPGCYEKMCQADPNLPWTDPISGEVDHETMAQDLAIDDGTDDFYEDDEYAM